MAAAAAVGVSLLAALPSWTWGTRWRSWCTTAVARRRAFNRSSAVHPGGRRHMTITLHLQSSEQDFVSTVEYSHGSRDSDDLSPHRLPVHMFHVWYHSSRSIELLSLHFSHRLQQIRLPPLSYYALCWITLLYRENKIKMWILLLVFCPGIKHKLSGCGEKSIKECSLLLYNCMLRLVGS